MNSLVGHPLTLRNQHLQLFPEKAIYWEEEQMLLLSDLHFGKATHFRKSGIPIPLKVFQNDIDRLSSLVDGTMPVSVCFLGDLFHSDYNEEFEWMQQWMQKYQSVKIELVRGNHDILPAATYKRAGIKVYPLAVQKGPFTFTHEPSAQKDPDKYLFSGHLHPGIHLKGSGRQSLSLPCFYFGENQALLPAFGAFTGFSLIRPRKNDRVFVIGDGKVMGV